jgi:transposase
MFWGCFSGQDKGPSLFWEKEWGTITQETYSERVIPLIHGWIQLKGREGIQLSLMQDHAPGHAGSITMEELRERGINLIDWPPFSPDLNPIETVWKWMKDWIEENYEDRQYSYNQLREIVKRAWEVVTPERLLDLLQTMPQRCQDVIDARGMHTKW